MTVQTDRLETLEYPGDGEGPYAAAKAVNLLVRHGYTVLSMGYRRTSRWPWAGWKITIELLAPADRTPEYHVAVTGGPNPNPRT